MARRKPGTTWTLVLVLLAAALLVAGVWVIAAGHLDAGIDLGIAALAVGGVALLLLEMRHAPRTELRIDQGELQVRFTGWDRLWALRRDVRIPVRQIDQVAVREVHTGEPRWWWRHRGTAVPGLIQAGSFATDGARELWDVREAALAVDIALAPDAPFRRLVLQVPDPLMTAEWLRASTRR